MDVIHTWKSNASTDLAISHLRDGGCVVLPTESTYEIVASPLNQAALEQLIRFTTASDRPAVVLGEIANLGDWLPLLRGDAIRVYRRMGSGPITLWADGGYSYGIFSHLPETARPLLVQDGQIAVRWPAHPIWSELRRANLPLVSVALPECSEPSAAARITNGAVRCVVDAGPTQHGASPSVMQATGRRCRLVREGVVKKEDFAELAMCRILFICTGNTCRSPMAEALCAKLLADRLKCSPDELPRHGFRVQSAGLSARTGDLASPDGVRVAADFGADLSKHRSQMASMEMLLLADHLFVMTASHVYALSPLKEITPHLLSPQGEDVVDPIGGELADYRECATQIIQYLQQRLPELLES